MSSIWKGPRSALLKILRKDGRSSWTSSDSSLYFPFLFRYITWVEKSEEQLEQEKKDRKKNKMLRDDEEITQMLV